jgi:hypothetical protein
MCSRVLSSPGREHCGFRFDLRFRLGYHHSWRRERLGVGTLSCGPGISRGRVQDIYCGRGRNSRHSGNFLTLPGCRFVQHVRPDQHRAARHFIGSRGDPRLTGRSPNRLIMRGCYGNDPQAGRANDRSPSARHGHLPVDVKKLQGVFSVSRTPRCLW